VSAPGTLSPREDRHKDGTLKARGHERDGLLHGYWEWFRQDGSRMRTGFFEFGEQVGEWTTYDRGGTQVNVTRFGGGAGA
jgi:antitoxin component YwqK of YwqJK toxin-antitoxin module